VRTFTPEPLWFNVLRPPAFVAVRTFTPEPLWFNVLRAACFSFAVRTFTPEPLWFTVIRAARLSSRCGPSRPSRCGSSCSGPAGLRRRANLHAGAAVVQRAEAAPLFVAVRTFTPEPL